MDLARAASVSAFVALLAVGTDPAPAVGGAIVAGVVVDGLPDALGNLLEDDRDRIQ